MLKERQELRQHNNDMNVDLVFTLSSFDFPFPYEGFGNVKKKVIVNKNNT